MNDKTDEEQNRFSARAARYVRVGTNVGAVAARVAGQRLFGMDGDDSKNAAALAAALGGLKGPIMKVAQLMATIPEALPPEYAERAVPAAVAGPADGPGLRAPAHDGRARARLGRALQELRAAAGGLRLARPGAPRRGARRRGRWPCKLQYPDMQSAVEADLNQLKVVFALHARMNPAVETGEILKEIVGAAARGARLRPRGAPHGALRRHLRGRAAHPRAGDRAGAVDQAAADHDLARGPAAARLQGGAARGPQRHRARHVPRLVVPVLALRRHPRRSASRQLHRLRGRTAQPAPASTCSTTAASAPSRRQFVQGVIDLYTGLLTRQARPRRARLRDVGLHGAVERADRRAEHLGALHLRAAARRPRARRSPRAPRPASTAARRPSPCTRRCKEKGPVRVPREFVFMDRAAIGLGGVFLHLRARLNWLPACSTRPSRASRWRRSARARRRRSTRPACRCRWPGVELPPDLIFSTGRRPAPSLPHRLPATSTKTPS